MSANDPTNVLHWNFDDPKCQRCRVAGLECSHLVLEASDLHLGLIGQL
jgi:hypothetical protein